MLEASPEERRAAALKKHAEARQRSINIEKFLKSKFREGCIEMRGMFETEDPDRSGSVCPISCQRVLSAWYFLLPGILHNYLFFLQVTHDSFLKVLAEAGLNLEKDHLAEFLSRCSIQPTRTHVPYREFLHRFQDRSDDGMAHTILTNPKHRYGIKQWINSIKTMEKCEIWLPFPQLPPCWKSNSRLISWSTWISAHQHVSEGLSGSLGHIPVSSFPPKQKLLSPFDILCVLKFHFLCRCSNIDKLGEDAIPQEAFRAAIESRFHLELTDEQFESLIDQVPLNDEGAVKYADFMAQFDTKWVLMALRHVCHFLSALICFLLG